jgi:hypothetical protein
MRVAVENQTPPNELMYRAAYRNFPPFQTPNLYLERIVEDCMYVRVVVKSSKRIAMDKIEKALDVGETHAS